MDCAVREVDTLVCGLGMAGLTFMALNCQKRSVLGVERRSYEEIYSDPISKAVILRASALPVLKELIPDAIQTLVRPLQTAHFVLDSQEVRLPLKFGRTNTYYAIDQTGIERALHSLLRPEQKLLGGTVQSLSRSKAGFIGDIAHSQVRQIKAKRIIISEGSGGHLTRSLGFSYHTLLEEYRLRTFDFECSNADLKDEIVHYLRGERHLSIIPLPTPFKFKGYCCESFPESELNSTLALLLACPVGDIKKLRHRLYISGDRRVYLPNRSGITLIGDCSWTPDSVTGYGVTKAIAEAAFASKMTTPTYHPWIMVLKNTRSFASTLAPSYLVATCALRFGSSVRRRKLRNAALILASFLQRRFSSHG